MMHEGVEFCGRKERMKVGPGEESRDQAIEKSEEEDTRQATLSPPNVYKC